MIYLGQGEVLRAEETVMTLLAPGDHQDVAGVLHHAPGCCDGMSEATNARHRPCPQAGALHHGGVHLHLAEYVQLGAPASVEVRVVLHHLDSGLHCVQEVPGLSEDSIPSPDSRLHPVQLSLVILGSQGARASVHHQHRGGGGGGGGRGEDIPTDDVA